VVATSSAGVAAMELASVFKPYGSLRPVRFLVAVPLMC
jgi:hypothetical protein